MERTKRNSARKENGEYNCKDNSQRDVVTRWDENKYVIVAIDNGHEKSTITNRLMKKY